MTSINEQDDFVPDFYREKNDWMGGEKWITVQRKGLQQYRHTCTVCGAKPVLRHVNRQSYCADHLKQAWAAQAAEPMPFMECVDYE